MICATKIIEFSAAHRVLYSKGPCENLHGHNYKAEITFCSEHLNENEMVIDFLEIKKIVKTWIDQNWDHNVILCEKDSELINALEKSIGQKAFVEKFNTTAESLAIFLLNLCNHNLFKQYEDIKCHKVRIWETDSSYADANYNNTTK